MEAEHDALASHTFISRRHYRNIADIAAREGVRSGTNENMNSCNEEQTDKP
jgi:hypothetical protein